MMSLVSSSADLAARAEAVIPGGVNSGNRRIAWPLGVTAASGATFTDADGQQLLDYHAAFGPLILGHNHPRVNAAVHQVIDRLDIVGIGVTDIEVELAETLVHHIPCAERVLLTNSGSEATYAALRLARAVTRRDTIIKFQGTYHGWHDAVLMNVISPPDRIGRKDPLSLGMLQSTIDETLVLPFNDVDALTEVLQQRGDTIAAILVEIIPHNIGCVLPEAAFLAALRQLTTQYGIVLIFDEVITGFRHALGGYQSLCGVTPDLATFAKAMANGYPIAALAGRAALMERFAPGGGVTFAGTYNAHPVGVTAALATIAELQDGRVHAHCRRLAERAAQGIREIAAGLGIPLTVVQFGSVFVPYFIDPAHAPLRSYEALLANDTARDVWFRSQMCARGIFMLPVAMKRNHVSAAHTDADIDRTLDAARAVLAGMPARI
jgi:glutamate-1-semialdehyde 2,1-aminomutase